MGTDAEILSLVDRFRACTLPRAEWTHRAHLAVAAWAIRGQGVERATAFLREGIRRYNRSVGNLTGYHETITLAYVAVIGRFLEERDRGQPLAELVADLVESCGARDHLLRFYTPEALRSDEARRGWVAPDVRPIGA